jgi:hypothetical protein
MAERSKNSIKVLISLLVFALILIGTSLFGYIFGGINLGVYGLTNIFAFLFANIFALGFAIEAIKAKESKSWIAYVYLFLFIMGVIWAAVDL